MTNAHPSRAKALVLPGRWSRERPAALVVATSLLFITAFSGCLFSPPETPARARYTSDKEPIDVKAGDIFVVELDANPTTGYRWEYAATQPKSSLQFIGSRFDRRVARPSFVGSAGKEFLVFKALSPGVTTLTLRYRRPWEKASAPDAETKKFTVRISDRRLGK